MERRKGNHWLAWTCDRLDKLFRSHNSDRSRSLLARWNSNSVFLYGWPETPDRSRVEDQRTSEDRYRRFVARAFRPFGLANAAALWVRDQSDYGSANDRLTEMDSFA